MHTHPCSNVLIRRRQLTDSRRARQMRMGAVGYRILVALLMFLTFLALADALRPLKPSPLAGEQVERRSLVESASTPPPPPTLAGPEKASGCEDVSADVANCSPPLRGRQIEVYGGVKAISTHWTKSVTQLGGGRFCMYVHWSRTGGTVHALNCSCLE